MIEKVQTKDQIESKRPISPVRYNSPPGPKPLSSVFTIQQDGDLLKNGLKTEILINDQQPQDLAINGTQQITNLAQSATNQLNVTNRKPSLSFKQLALVQTRLKSEMNDSRVKLKAIDFDKQSNDHSEGK